MTILDGYILAAVLLTTNSFKCLLQQNRHSFSINQTNLRENIRLLRVTFKQLHIRKTLFIQMEKNLIQFRLIFIQCHLSCCEAHFLNMPHYMNSFNF